MRWVNWFYKTLSIKKAVEYRVYAANRQSTSSYSRIKKKRRRLMCESQETQKTFHRFHTKDCFTVQSFEIMIKDNSYWLFQYGSRSQHDMYENIKSLFANSVLSLLTIALTNQVFQNYESFEEIETISSSANEFLHHLRIKKNLLRVSFFQIISANELTEKIHEASSFSRSILQLVHVSVSCTP